MTEFLIAEYLERRTNFLANMPNNSVAIFFAGSDVNRSQDTDYPFCQNKYFYYLTGFPEPDAVLVLVKNTQNQQLLFCRDKDPLQEIWHGRRIGAELAKTQFGFDDSFVLAELDEQLPNLLNGKSCVLHLPYLVKEHDLKIERWVTVLRNASKSGKKAPCTFIDCRSQLDEMRLVKSAAEIAVMSQANIISGKAHQRAMAFTQPSVFEYQIEAEILHEFAMHNARYPAYGTIVGAGENATILHYTDNNCSVKSGDLVLIDAGAEYAGYAADITRTFPVNGRFSPEQAALYNLVLAAQNAAIDAIKPKMTFAKLNLIVNEILTKGLWELGIISGDLTQLITDKACKQYFIHGLGHWLGLDVHDVGDYQVNEKREQLREFVPGMVMTIEPGLYINNDADVDEKWRGIGIRIEDNILVTEEGYRNLTVNAPKTIEAIQALMAKQ